MFVRLYAFIIALSIGALSAAGEPIRVVSETGDAAIIAQVREELAEADAPETVFEARRQARRAAERAEAYLNSRGYFAAQISYAVEAGPPIQPTIKVEPGLLFRLSSIELDLGGDALANNDEIRLQKVMTMTTGDLALPGMIVAQEAGLLAALKSFGYGDAEVRGRDALGDRDAGTLDVTYRLRPGPRIRFGKVIYPEDTRVRRTYLQRLVPFEESALYAPDALSEFNRRLSATRTYSVSSARLSAVPGHITQEGDEVRDVIVTLVERPRYTLLAGASVSTSEGPGVTSSLTRRNATRRGDTLTGSLTIAAQQRTLGVDWRIPNITAYNRSLALSADATREETDAFDREALTLTGAFEFKHTPRLTTAFGVEGEFTREDDALGQRDLQILSVSAGARLDRSDDPLDPTRGWRADLRAEPALAVGDRESQFFTLNGQVSAYRPVIAERLVAAGRVRGGFVYGANIEDLPVSRRFFAGGGGSARGFAYQSVGPKDLSGDPIGGRGLLEFSGELRWQGRGNLGYAAFVDGATVSASEVPSFDDLRYSAGFGIRYKTVVGPIRFDIATPLNKQEGDDPVQIYVSLGQAF